MPDGIAPFLLWECEGKAFSRRLTIFRDKVSKGANRFYSDEPVYGKREKVRLDFAITAPTGKPLRGDFSVSVTDAKQIAPDAETDHVVSNLLLTSDLKGYIENPGWYFMPTNQETRNQMLDYVMMTHGWSRFLTDDLRVFPKYELNEPIEVGQYISGRVEGINPKEKGNMISAYNPDE